MTLVSGFTPQDDVTAARLAGSVAAGQNDTSGLSPLKLKLREYNGRARLEVRRVGLGELTGWRRDGPDGNLTHETGRFFSVTGMRIFMPDAAVPSWDQPIINQPEIGILGILMKEFRGILHCLMQAKVEPGNCNGVQISPTVQATRSNYTGAHLGKAVPYIEYFLDPGRLQTVADVLQSEQGSWFYHKRNRNMILEVTEDVPVADGFFWITLGQLHRMLEINDLVNMDARSVLACMPLSGPDHTAALNPRPGGFAASLIRSLSENGASLHSTADIMRWVTTVRSMAVARFDVTPLAGLREWSGRADTIAHRSGHCFEIFGVTVRAESREVSTWDQPMLPPYGVGLIAFLVTRIAGVLHALARIKIEPGYTGVAELAPTIQCRPDNYDCLPAAARPPFLDEILSAPSSGVRFDVLLSEEGGRFYHTRNRYLVIETKRRWEHPEFRWLTIHQLQELLQKGLYVNVQARSLIACMQTLCVSNTR